MKSSRLVSFVVAIIVVGFASHSFALPRRFHKIYQYKPPICKSMGDASVSKLENVLAAKYGYFSQEFTEVKNEACKHSEVSLDSKAYAPLRKHVASLIGRLGASELGDPNTSHDNYGQRARDYYFLIRCYVQRLGLSLEDFGVNESDMKQMVRARVMETSEDRMKDVRIEAVELLSIFSDHTRDHVRPIIFRDHRQNLENLKELL
ncbi:MAG: hypothetical protein ACD_15C00186G0001 [uncultured bacterium]|nr:MAG: hypothetical protein ACD_15C00186G0001 [uncultured bacterium]